MPDYSQFRFNPADLAKPRKFGISAYMRIKNEEEFVRLAIESHLPFYDEIVAVYNDCKDNTEAILLELQAQYPEKIRVFHYLPKVFAALTPEQAASVGRDDDVHALANYYNWAQAKCAYQIVTKLDADHVAIPHALGPAVAEIRKRFVAGEDKMFVFSGLNVGRSENGELGMDDWQGEKTAWWYGGHGDHWYYRLSEKSFFINRKEWEVLSPDFQHPRPVVYAGLLYIHVRHLKAIYGNDRRSRIGWIPFSGFVQRALDEYKTKARALSLPKRLREYQLRRRGRNQILNHLRRGYASLPNARVYNLKKEVRQIVRSDVLRTINDWVEPTRMPKIPPIYVVSLARTPKRRAHITSLLDAAGVDYQIVDAVDGEKLDLTHLADRLNRTAQRRKYTAEMTRGQIGCFLSHYQLWQRMVAENTQHALILEDDAMLEGDFFQTVQDTLRSGVNWNVVHLIHTEHRKNEVIHHLEQVGKKHRRRLVRLKYQRQTTAAYLINLGGAKKLLKLCYEICEPVDMQWKHGRRVDLEFYHVDPSPAFLDGALGTTIGDFFAADFPKLKIYHQPRNLRERVAYKRARRREQREEDKIWQWHCAHPPRKTRPAVSVIIPAYNAEKTLAKAVQSILNQTFSDFELLIIDDGSCDRTLQIAQDFDDPRIRVFCNPENLGIPKTRNIGWRAARGEFIAWQDADDYSLPARLEKQVAYLYQNPAVGVLGVSTQSVDARGKVLWENRFQTGEVAMSDMQKANVIEGGPTMCRRGLLEKVGGFDAWFGMCEDYDCWLRIAATGARIHALGEQLYVILRDPKSTTGSVSQNLRPMRLYHLAALANARGKLSEEARAAVQKGGIDALEPTLTKQQKTDLVSYCLQKMPVYVVSLASSRQRRAQIGKKLAAAHVDYEFIDAVDGNKLNLENLPLRVNRHKFKLLYSREILPGEIGCFLSHYHLWERMAQYKIPFALVLEDDAQWEDDFFDTVSDVRATPYNWNVVHFAKTDYQTPQVEEAVCEVGGRQLVRLREPTDTTIAYMVDLAGAKKLLKLCREIYAPVDEFWKQYWRVNLQFYHIHPAPVKDLPEESIIGPTRGSLMNYPSRDQLVSEYGLLRYKYKKHLPRWHERSRARFHRHNPPRKRQ